MKTKQPIWRDGETVVYFAQQVKQATSGHVVDDKYAAVANNAILKCINTVKDEEE